MLYLVFKYKIYIITNINNMTDEDIDRTLDDDDDFFIKKYKDENQ